MYESDYLFMDEYYYEYYEYYEYYDVVVVVEVDCFVEIYDVVVNEFVYVVSFVE